MTRQAPINLIREQDYECEGFATSVISHADGVMTGPGHVIHMAARQPSNESSAVDDQCIQLEQRILGMAPSAVIRGPQALIDAGLIEWGDYPLHVGVLGNTPDLTIIGCIRCFAHSNEWRRVLTATNSLSVSGDADRPLPRMSGASALAELLLMEIELAPPAEAINFEALSPVQEIQFRRFTGMIHAGPLIEAYRYFRHRHTTLRDKRSS